VSDSNTPSEILWKNGCAYIYIRIVRRAITSVVSSVRQQHGTERRRYLVFVVVFREFAFRIEIRQIVRAHKSRRDANRTPNLLEGRNWNTEYSMSFAAFRETSGNVSTRQYRWDENADAVFNETADDVLHIVYGCGARFDVPSVLCDGGLLFSRWDLFCFVPARDRILLPRHV